MFLKRFFNLLSVLPFTFTFKYSTSNILSTLSTFMNTKVIIRAHVCKNQTNSKFRGKGEKFDFFLILILDRLDYN